MPLEKMPPHPAPRGIAIVGFGTTKVLAPFSDDRWYCWSMNDSYRYFASRLSNLFEMHPIAHYTDPKHYPALDGVSHETRLAELAEKGVGVFLAFANPKIPKARTYPFDEIITRYKRDYFCSSICYMIPLAMMVIEKDRDAKGGFFLPQIGMFGCDMQLTSEYAKERACTEYWLGRAEGLGIEVVIPDDSPILKAGYRYGYETETISARRRIIEARRNDIDIMVHDAQVMAEDAKNRLSQLLGMRDELEFIDVNLTDKPPSGKTWGAP